VLCFLDELELSSFGIVIGLDLQLLLSCLLYILIRFASNVLVTKGNVIC